MDTHSNSMYDTSCNEFLESLRSYDGAPDAPQPSSEPSPCFPQSSRPNATCPYDAQALASMPSNHETANYYPGRIVTVRHPTPIKPICMPPTTALLQTLHSDLVVSVFAGLSAHVGHGLAEESFDTMLAGVLVLCRRARFRPHELNDVIVCACLWCLARWKSQLGSSLNQMLGLFTQMYPCSEAQFRTLQEGMLAMQLTLLKRCGWDVGVYEDQVQLARRELSYDPLFPTAQAHINAEIWDFRHNKWYRARGMVMLPTPAAGILPSYGQSSQEDAMFSSFSGGAGFDSETYNDEDDNEEEAAESREIEEPPFLGDHAQGFPRTHGTGSVPLLLSERHDGAKKKSGVLGKRCSFSEDINNALDEASLAPKPKRQALATSGLHVFFSNSISSIGGRLHSLGESLGWGLLGTSRRIGHEA